MIKWAQVKPQTVKNNRENVMEIWHLCSFHVSIWGMLQSLHWFRQIWCLTPTVLGLRTNWENLNMGSKMKAKPRPLIEYLSLNYMQTWRFVFRIKRAATFFIVRSRQVPPPCSSPPSRVIMTLWSSSLNSVPPLNSRQRYAAEHNDVCHGLCNTGCDGECYDAITSDRE